MARRRMIDPEFWADEKVGSLTPICRLMFIGMWNFADDEGLIRFSPEYIKANIFSYDTFQNGDIKHEMDSLADKKLVFPYVGGTTNQRYAYIVNFHKHQTINRPQPSKLPPPSLQNIEVKEMYMHRDGCICHLCKGPVELVAGEYGLSLDHVLPVSRGGNDYPSNIKSSHLKCNKSRGNSLIDSMNGSMSDSVVSKDKLIEDKLIELIGVWNTEMDWKVVSTNRYRIKHFTERIKEPMFNERFKDILTKIRASHFLSGRKTSPTHPNFRADFDWVIANDQNYVKILEGKYDNKRGQS